MTAVECDDANFHRCAFRIYRSVLSAIELMFDRIQMSCNTCALQHICITGPTVI